jgi:hypothetical protein
MTALSEGPYAQSAVLCETFIRGAESGQMTLVNILEGIGVSGPDLRAMTPIVIGAPIKLVVRLCGGDSTERYSLGLRSEAPSGTQRELLELADIEFSKAEGNIFSTVLPMPQYEVTEPGTHWFDLLIRGHREEQPRLLTRIPLNVSYQPRVTLRTGSKSP